MTVGSSLTLHDALALGQYEDALALTSSWVFPDQNDHHHDDDHDDDHGDIDHDDNHDDDPLAEQARATKQQTTPSFVKAQTSIQESHRLPLLLRLLSASRSLASLPDVQTPDKGGQDAPTTTTTDEVTHNNHNYINNETTDAIEKDVWLDDVVQRLEDRAALYSQAEGVEVLAGHLAPRVCRKWSKLAPLTCYNNHANNKNNNNNNSAQNYQKHGGATLGKHSRPQYYDTSGLEQAARQIMGQRRKLSETSIGAFSEEGNVLDDYNRIDVHEEEEEEEQEEDDAAEDSHGQSPPPPPGRDARPNKRRRRQLSTASSSQASRTSNAWLGPPDSPLLHRPSTSVLSMTEREFAAEDSQQALATKSWTELALLVAQSLQTPLPTTIAIHSMTNETSGTQATLALTVDEASILAQAQSSTGNNSSSSGKNKSTGIMSADLAATLASLLFHTPVLRFDHVATALCRVGLPQAVDVCARLGANTPAAIPSLLKGCYLVVQAAAQLKSSEANVTLDDEQPTRKDKTSEAVATTALQSIRALAMLSPFEQARTGTVLRFVAQIKTPQALLLELELAIRPSNGLALALLIDEYAESLHWMTPEGSTSNSSSVSLGSLLYDSPRMQVRALNCLQSSVTDTKSIRIEWILPAYLNILALGRAGPMATFDWIMDLIHPQNLDELSSVVFRKFFTIGWLGLAQCLASRSSPVNTMKTCRKILETFLGHKSSKHAAFLAHVVCTWKMAKREHLGKLVWNALGLATERESMSLQVAGSIAERNHLVASCAPALQLIEDCKSVFQNGLAEAAVLADPSSAAQCLSIAPEAFEQNQVQQTLGAMLEMSEPATLASQAGTLDFLVAAIKLSMTSNGAGVPAVLPVHLERMAFETQFDPVDNARSDKSIRFLLNLAYSICFSQEQPESPFCVDLRSFPIHEICFAVEHSAIAPDLREYIIAGLQKSCPEVVLENKACKVFQQVIYPTGRFYGLTIHDLKQELIQAIRSAIERPSEDVNGEKVEAVFCQAYGRLQQAPLCCAVASAMLSQSSPLTVFPYLRLCMDPVLLLKCPLNCWDRPGLRRVILWVLWILIGVNDKLTRFTNGDRREAFEEFVSSRNMLLIRCMTALLTDCSSMRSCQMTVCFLRSLVSQCPGVGAAILRQGMSDGELDWLIENIPELMMGNEGQTYHNLLSLSTIQTTSERLVAASAVLHLCILHGHRNESQAQSLALVAVSQLIANFFIILGPVGVPVQTFVGDNYSSSSSIGNGIQNQNDKGTDATQICRRATFRMLKSMAYVRASRPQLRGECVMALQKLGRLCKGEEIVSGLPASLASRQKSFVREMMDIINKTLVAMGNGGL